jgi:hypothetical protein
MIGVVALAAVSAAYALGLSRLRRRGGGAAQPAAWWRGYARDAVNLLGLLGFSTGFAIAGLAGPLALLAGATLTLVAYGLDHLLGRDASGGAGLPAVAVITLGAAIAGGLARPIERGLAAVVQGLF